MPLCQGDTVGIMTNLGYLYYKRSSCHFTTTTRNREKSSFSVFCEKIIMIAPCASVQTTVLHFILLICRRKQKSLQKTICTIFQSLRMMIFFQNYREPFQEGKNYNGEMLCTAFSRNSNFLRTLLVVSHKIRCNFNMQ